MKPWLAFATLVDQLTLRFAQLATWLVLITCLISATVAFARYGLSIGSNAFLEIQWYLFGALVMLGAPFVLKVNEHVRVDILYGRLSNRGKATLDLLGFIFFLLPTTVLLMWLGWKFFHLSWVGNEMSSNPGGLVRWPAKVVQPLGFALLTLQGLAEIIKRVAYLRGELQMDAHYERPVQ